MAKADFNRRGRRPSLKVAARKTVRIQGRLEDLLTEIKDLEVKLLKLQDLLDAAARAEQMEKKRRSRRYAKGIRGKGPSVRDTAYKILSARKRPMAIQEISRRVLKGKPGKAGANFTQNLGAALARDKRFIRSGRGLYSIKK